MAISTSTQATSSRCASKTRASTTSGTSWGSTLNAALPFGDAVVSALVLRPGFPLRGGCHRLRVRVQPERHRLRFAGLRFRRRPARLRDESRRDADHHVRGAPVLAGRLEQPLGVARRRLLQPGGAARPRSTASCAATRTRRRSNTSMPTSRTSTGNPLAPTDRWFLGRYDTELDQTAVFGELSFDVTENFTITAGGRWFDYDRKFAQEQEQPEGFTGFSRARRQPEEQRRRHGLETELHVQARPRPAGLCHVLGGLPRRRQQSAETGLGAAARLQVRRR